MKPLFDTFNLDEDKGRMLALYGEVVRCRREERKARRATVRARIAAWAELARQCKARKMKLRQLADVLGMGNAPLSNAIHNGDRNMSRDDLNRVFREWEKIDEGVRKFRRTYGAFLAKAKEM